MHIKIALLQLNAQVNCYESNLKNALTKIDEAASKGAQIICLPEAFATSLDIPNAGRIGQDLSGEIIRKLIEKAIRHNVNICAGLLEKSGKNCYSTVAFISNNGQLLGKYRRRNITKFEERFLEAGNMEKILDLPFGKVGLLLGNDIFSPKLCDKYQKEKVQLIICPSVLPLNQRYTVLQLLKARAIDNSCYIAFISQVGFNIFADHAYMGYSSIIGTPSQLMNIHFDFEEGEEVICCGDETHEEILVSTIELINKKTIAQKL